MASKKWVLTVMGFFMLTSSSVGSAGRVSGMPVDWGWERGIPKGAQSQIQFANPNDHYESNLDGEDESNKQIPRGFGGGSWGSDRPKNPGYEPNQFGEDGSNKPITNPLDWRIGIGGSRTVVPKVPQYESNQYGEDDSNNQSSNLFDTHTGHDLPNEPPYEPSQNGGGHGSNQPVLKTEHDDEPSPDGELWSNEPAQEKKEFEMTHNAEEKPDTKYMSLRSVEGKILNKPKNVLLAKQDQDPGQPVDFDWDRYGVLCGKLINNFRLIVFRKPHWGNGNGDGEPNMSNKAHENQDDAVYWHQ